MWRADIALNLINKLHGIERGLKACSDDERKIGRHEQSLPILAQLNCWIEMTQPQVTAQNVLSKAVSYLASNWSKFEEYVEEPTAKSLMRGCVTHWNACEAGGFYGALTTDLHYLLY